MDFPSAAQARDLAKKTTSRRHATDAEIMAIGKLIRETANARTATIEVPRRGGMSPRAWADEIVVFLKSKGYSAVVKTLPHGDPVAVVATW